MKNLKQNEIKCFCVDVHLIKTGGKKTRQTRFDENEALLGKHTNTIQQKKSQNKTNEFSLALDGIQE